MKLEYKSVAIGTSQNWGGSSGKIDTDALDVVLNDMAREGWKLHSIEGLQHTAGSKTLLCVFEREEARN